MRVLAMKHWRLALLLVCVSVLSSQPSGREQVGKLADGSFLLSTGWRIQPVGTQVPLDTFPMSSALSRDGKFLLVLNGGYRPPTISVLALSDIKGAGMQEIAKVPVADGWLGLTFSPDGTRVYVGGGSKYCVYEFSFSPDGRLSPTRALEVTPGAKPGEMDFIGDVAVSPDGRSLLAADLYHDSVVAFDTQSGRVTAHYKTGRRPYRILFLPDGKTYFVSSWADSTVYLYETRTGSESTRIRLGPHTTDMVLSDRKTSDDDGDERAAWRYRLFVTAANTNQVFVVSVSDANVLKLQETLNVAMTPRQPAGMTPSGLALSPDQERLFVACSDANVVAVADISEARSQLEGFIPAGWYPTATRVLPDGRVLILNGRGLASYPSSYPGPRAADTPANRQEFVAYRQTGTLSVIDPLTDEALGEYTKSAMSLMPYRDEQLDAANATTGAGPSVIDSSPERPSPIQHVIYIIKENRTYDQVFGKIGKGNGDPSLTMFDESAAPNHYKLAREFVLFDNFYVNADVSADGHNWAMAGIAPDYTQRLWPNEYGKRSPYYGFEGDEPANSPPAGYIWSNAIAAGLSVRNYGEFVANKKQAGSDGIQVDHVTDPSLQGITNLRYRGFDLDYPDVERAKVFLDDLKQFENSGQMPRLMIVRLGNDHTNGTTAGKLTPLALFADNDYGLGMIVEGVSKSRFWNSTAIFAMEDDAQNGPDHVDSHRSLMLAISPFTHRGAIDSTMYNQSSVMRTMELILGLRPMTQFDAAGRPLTAAFAAAPNPAPYTAENPRISLTTRNPAGAPTAKRSEHMDFEEADRIDDDELNGILWAAIKGTDAPPPVRSYFSRP
jgi:DNA-binding beta-propeller fold protein YncE